MINVLELIEEGAGPLSLSLRSGRRGVKGPGWVQSGYEELLGTNATGGDGA